MRLLDGILKQVRKPTGLLGQMMAQGMNRTHDARTNWGLQFVNIFTETVEIENRRRYSCSISNPQVDHINLSLHYKGGISSIVTVMFRYAVSV